MPAQTPLTLVYQEIRSSTVDVVEPTLPALIAGPCYHIKDYPADKSDIALTEYGTAGAANDPLAWSFVSGTAGPGADAIVVAEPPANVSGALLDHSSVEVWAQTAHVQIAHGDGAAGASFNPDGSSPAVKNLFEAESGTDFTALGVQAGDRLVVTYDAGGTDETEVLTVLAVAPGGTDERLTTTSDTTLSVFTAVDWRVERVLSDIQVASDFIALSGNEVTIKGGMTHSADLNSDGSLTDNIVSYADLYLGYTSLRQDLAKLTEVDATNVGTLLGPSDERNPLRVGADIALLHSGSSKVYAWGVLGDDLNGASDTLSGYTAMLELISTHETLYSITPLTFSSTVRDAIANHCAAYSEPERAKFRIAITGYGELPVTKTLGTAHITGDAQKLSSANVNILMGDSGGDSPAWVTNGLAAGDKIFLIDPSDLTGAAAFDFVGSWDVDEVYDDDRIRIDDAAFDALGEVAASAAYSFALKNGNGVVLRTRSIGLDATDTLDTINSGLTADDDGMILLLQSPDTGNANKSPSLDNYFYIVDGAAGTVLGDGTATWGTTETITAQIIEPVYVDTTGNVDLESRYPLRKLTDPGATFITDGVVAGDFVEIPVPAVSEGTDFDSGVYAAQVLSVDSNNQLTLIAGVDLPTTGIDSQTDIGYRVSRTLDKAGQRDELVGVVSGSGYESKRLVLVWPDEVLIEGVQNAKTGTQSRQPGYYLACAVAGMSAGLPPHQGMTNLTLTGFDEIYNGARYFDPDDLAEISNAGFFVVSKPTASAPAYVLHQLTTDDSSLQSRELSMVRNFDYVSRAYKEVIDTYIGRYNITATTLDLIRESIDLLTSRLKGERLPKIGAPVIEAFIRSLTLLPGASDHVEVLLEIDFPAPLNRVSLRLRA